MEDIFNSYAELGQLCMRNREGVIDYIDRVRTMYSNIIEAQKRLREPLRPPNVDIARINERFVHSFYSGLSSVIRTLRKENDLPPAKCIRKGESRNRGEIPSAAGIYFFRFPHYDSALPPSKE